MNEQKVVDFESELIGLCSKYEKEMPHGALVGTLDIVAHIYMDAQLKEFIESGKLEEKGASPLPAETKK